jgi:hypothetical protein
VRKIENVEKGTKHLKFSRNVDFCRFQFRAFRILSGAFGEALKREVGKLDGVGTMSDIDAGR